MKIFALSPKTLLTESKWNNIRKYADLVFVGKDEIATCDFQSNDEVCILLDPDYFDWKLPESFFKRVPNLKAVCLGTTTLSYIDESYLLKKNVKIYNLPNYSTNSVAEYLMFFMYCLAKKLPLQLKNGSQQDFSNRYLQVELTGKTAGVVGLGNIGETLAKKLNGIGMNVIYYNRSAKESEFKRVGLEQLFKQADVIFLTIANNKQTRKLISDEMLLSMKKSAIFISNTGIELHNDQIIREMLKQGKLFGFGAELPNKSYKDYEGNAMITSEYAWFTKDAATKRKNMIYKNLLSVIRN